MDIVDKMEEGQSRDNPTTPVMIPLPAHLAIEKPHYRPGVARVPVDRFFKQEYHDLEVERIWKKVWQWACREEEIPEVGDYHVYEVAELSFIVMRTGKDEIKAYWNSCPHRARQIATFDGKRVDELRCMFHGWAWNLDGSLKEMSCGWDFTGAKPEEVRLKEVKVGVWGGYVFINPDPECESLEEFLGELPMVFEGSGHDLGKRWKQVHVTAHVEANWKVVQEAFLEGWHVGTTHPQLYMPLGGRDGEGAYAQRWDDFGNWMRIATGPASETRKPAKGMGSPSDTEEQYPNSFFDYHLNEDQILLEDGETGLAAVHKRVREYHRTIIGDEVDQHSDYFMNAAEMQMVWPNFHPWQAFSRLMYRFRPYKNDPLKSVMDVLLLAPWPEDRPRPAPCKAQVLDFGESITDAVGLGQLARIFAQDLANIPFVQKGLQSCQREYVLLSDVLEAPLRHWHDHYNRWMGLDNSDGRIGVSA